jgi:hypothetical protein
MPNEPIDNDELNDEPLDDENEDSQDEEEEDESEEGPELSSTEVGEEGDLEDGLFRKEERERKKADMLENYRRKMSDMDDIARMCSTTMWHDIQAHVKAEEIKETAKLKTSDKSREMIHAQEAVRILPEIISLVSKRVFETEAFINSCPKYATDEMPRRVTWDEETSTPVFSHVADLQEELALD